MDPNMLYVTRGETILYKFLTRLVLVGRRLMNFFPRKLFIYAHVLLMTFQPSPSSRMCSECHLPSGPQMNRTRKDGLATNWLSELK